MRSPLHQRTLLLGVTGSIAAFKAAALASMLTQEGARVITLLTPSATRFLTPLTFQALTGQKAYTQDDLWGPEGHILHIDLARQAEAMLIVPCTAETIAQLAQGHGNTLVSLAALALDRKRTPLILAPAMDAGMFTHPAVQDNLERLKQQGVHVLGPVYGRLASGEVAQGRMVEPEEIVNYLRLLFARQGPLQGRHVVVTAGPTREPLDPVRVFTNRSSGKQGYALAEAARDLGARVTLISGPTQLPAPYGVELRGVETARDMYQALMEVLPETDILLKVAAVADYRPAERSTEKVKKGRKRWTITLEANPDLLQAVQAYRAEHGRPRWVVGFAAESRLDEDLARQKLQAKKLDLLLLNDITRPDAGFAVDTNQGILLDRDGHRQTFPVMSKRRVADLILSWVLYLEQGHRLCHVVPWETWLQARERGTFFTASMAHQGRLALARPDQLLRWVARQYPHPSPENLVVLTLDAREWVGRWSWVWEEGEWWPYLHVQEPIPVSRIQASPFHFEAEEG